VYAPKLEDARLQFGKIGAIQVKPISQAWDPSNAENRGHILSICRWNCRPPFESSDFCKANPSGRKNESSSEVLPITASSQPHFCLIHRSSQVACRFLKHLNFPSRCWQGRLHFAHGWLPLHGGVPSAQDIWIILKSMHKLPTICPIASAFL